MMLTSTDQPSDIARCRELGVAAYLVKPIEQAELREAILTALGSSATPSADADGDRRKKTPKPARSLHVLLADDQPINLRVAVRMLEKRGHTVKVASNGQEAIEALARHSFDLLIMDIQMPVMDGIEATRAIRRQEQGTLRHLPIVALTAYAIKGDRECFLEEGFDGYLSKPITSLELYETIEGLALWSVPSSTGIPESSRDDVLAPGQLDASWNRTAALRGSTTIRRSLKSWFRCSSIITQNNWPNLKRP